MTLGIKVLFVTIRMSDNQHKWHSVFPSSAIMMSLIMSHFIFAGNADWLTLKNQYEWTNLAALVLHKGSFLWVECSRKYKNGLIKTTQQRWSTWKLNTKLSLKFRTRTVGKYKENEGALWYFCAIGFKWSWQF